MKTRLLIFCIGISNLVFCQDFNFTWQIHTSLVNRSYIVKITQHDSKRYIYLKKYNWRHFKSKKIDKNNCDSLLSFLNSYDFPTKGSTISRPYREYIDTKWLADSNLVILHNDTLRRGQLNENYIFDSDSNKYYCNATWFVSWTDGTTYEGEYITSFGHKDFSVYCVRLNDKDYFLNKLIYSLVIKYYREKQYIYLGDLIEDDKPRKENKY